MKFCPNCNQYGYDIEKSKQENTNPYFRKHPFYQGYFFGDKANNDFCPVCSHKFEEPTISEEDIDTIKIASNYNRQLLEAMIDLKQKDIIEYELKMGQFRAQAQRQRASQKSAVSSNTPKCPTCGSTHVYKISTTAKAANTVLLGVFGTKRYKTFHCDNCGYEW